MKKRYDVFLHRLPRFDVFLHRLPRFDVFLHRLPRFDVYLQQMGYNQIVTIPWGILIGSEASLSTTGYIKPELELLLGSEVDVFNIVGVPEMLDRTQVGSSLEDLKYTVPFAGVINDSTGIGSKIEEIYHVVLLGKMETPFEIGSELSDTTIKNFISLINGFGLSESIAFRMNNNLSSKIDERLGIGSEASLVVARLVKLYEVDNKKLSELDNQKVANIEYILS